MTIKVINAAHVSATVSVGANWFTSDIGIGDLPAAKHTLQMAVATSSVVNVILKNNSVETTMAVNDGTALPANAGHQHIIMLRPGDTYNVQHATGETNKIYCLIVESDNVDM